MSTTRSPVPGASGAPGAVERAERRIGLTVLASGLVVVLVLGALLLPWGPVPGGTPAPVAASEVFTDAEVARAEAYSRGARAWGWTSLAVATAVVVLLGLTRLGPRLVGRLPGPWPLRAALAAAVVVLLEAAVTLPFAVGLRALQRDVGLSTQSWGGFARDVLVGHLLSLGITVVAVVVLVGLARRLPRAWPAAVGALLAAFVGIASFLHPVVVEPLFNEFEPLADGSLRTSVVDLAQRQGVALDRVLVADASRRTTTLNAYVSGYGDTRRVVLYDTTVGSLPPGQLLSIVAHELSHARHGDVLVGTGLGAGGAFAAAGALALLVPRRRGGVRRPESVPRVLALLTLATLLLAPIQNGASRLVETRADVDALAATQDPRSFSAMQVRLARRSLADPTPPAWSHWWFGSHPTVLERLALARAMEERRRAGADGLSGSRGAAPS